MRQKTFTTTTMQEEYFEIGDEVILLEKENPLRGTHWFVAVPHTGRGIPGNLDHTVCAYHGWRGTTNDTRTEAHGVRRIIKIVDVPPTRERDGYRKITVGPDLHPDWE